MIDNLARAFPRERPGHPPVAPHIEIVPSRQQRRARPRVVYALATVAGIFAILMTQLLVSIAVADGTYQIASLQVQQRDLARTEQAKQEALNMLRSTQNLAANAEALGMVSNINLVYLSVADAAVIGDPAVARADAGSVTGATGNLIANSLLAEVPLVDPAASVPPAGELAPADAAGAGAPAAPAVPAPVASQPQGIPSPVTH